MCDQRHARGRLEEMHLVPELALTEHVAMVGREDDRGVVSEAGLLECK
jgi:hypothetical protein